MVAVPLLIIAAIASVWFANDVAARFQDPLLSWVAFGMAGVLGIWAFADTFDSLRR